MLIPVSLILVTHALHSKSLWVDKNIYSSGENLQVGDIIAVNIDDISRMRYTIELSDDNSFSISSNPDANLTGFLPKVNSNRQAKSGEKTNVTGRGNLKITIGVLITRKREDGKLDIAGTREYSFNGITNRFAVSGIVDPRTVEGGTVHSKEIANFRLEIRGLKEAAGINIQRPPLKEEDSASAELTEEEKQRIIVDYLNKMLRELAR